jgi:hypothetical protein
MESRVIILSTLAWSLFSSGESCSTQTRLTKRAPDGWDWARFLELFLSFGSFPFPSFVLPSRRYRLLQLSSARINPFCSSRIGPKRKSADRAFALRADFLLPETVIFFLGNASPSPSACALCRGSTISCLSIKTTATRSNQVLSCEPELLLEVPTSWERSCARSA